MSDSESDVTAQEGLKDEDWEREEKSLIEAGKTYGLTGKELLGFVERRLDQRREREQRVAERAYRQQELEFERERERHRHDQEMAQLTVKEVGKPQLSEDSAGIKKQATKLDIPKYNGKGEVAEYLDLFEAVAKQNGSAKGEWPLLLRTAVVGTVLEDSVCLEDFNDYDDIRSELLLSFGKTASEAWKEMLACSQRNETFRQYCLRVARLVNRWLKLTFVKTKAKDVSAAKLLEAVVTQLVLESVEPNLAAYLRRTCRSTEPNIDDLCSAGSTYQTSFSVRGKQKEVNENDKSKQNTERVKAASKGQSSSGASWSKQPRPESSPSTTQCFGVSYEEAEKKLFAVTRENRRAYMAKHNLCWNCLGKGHRASKCFAKGKCTKCSKKHHVLLHDVPFQMQSSTSASSEINGIKTYGCQMSGSRQITQVYLMTAVAEVKGETLRARVRVFIDPGSQACFVSSALVQAIQPRCLGSEAVTIVAFGAQKTREDLERYELSLSLLDGRSLELQAIRKDSLGLDIPTVSPAVIEKWQSRGVEINDRSQSDVPSEVHVLLGADCASKLLKDKQEWDGEIAWRTEIGWVLTGSQVMSTHPGERLDESKTSVGYVGMSSRSDLSPIKRLWEMEEPNFTRKESEPNFPLKKTGERYEVGLLWKDEGRPDDNRSMAQAAVRRTIKRLERLDKIAPYEEVLLKEYRQLGAIELEPDPSTPGYCMPHHAVLREEAATTKTRVVFNASAAAQGERSLNDTVDSGPSLLPDLTSLLLRLREFAVGFQADIRKAFFMIEVREEDRKFLRFLWPDDAGSLVMWRLKRLPFGVNCSPFLLAAVLHHHLREERAAVKSAAEAELLDLLLDSFYVDDVVSSLDSVEEAVVFRQTSVQCLERAGMDLRKWRGNAFLSDDEAGGKVLGLLWSEASDRLSLVIPEASPDPQTPWTRRSLLRAVATLFDPLGVASPVALTGKILLQTAWKTTSSWDEALDDDLSRHVDRWWGEIQALREFSVPRWIESSSEEAVNVHFFADASEQAYGCCCYVVSSQGSHLIYAKSKVAPLRPPTLPRMELQAACLASRRIKFVLSALRVDVLQVWGWSDSLTTLHWIRGCASNWKTWVRNRVAAIQEVSEELGISWRHCPGVCNPADAASRGTKTSELKESLWLHGPHWLPNKSAWPPGKSSEMETPQCSTELQVQVAVVTKEMCWWERQSRWSRLIGTARRLVSWVPRSKSALLCGEQQRKAEALLFRMAQREEFPAEVQLLSQGEPVPRSSKLFVLQPFLDDDGVMRVSGRLANSELLYEAKHPVVLSKHHITETFLRHCHEVCFHQGVEAVAAKVRQTHWVIGLRRMLRSIKSKCVTCRRHHGKLADECSPPLPIDRVVFKRPFCLCGIDYAGPLLTKEEQHKISKVWIALFVCGITRAVHIEVVKSLSIDDFLLALRRFMARRGRPQRIRSDNAAQFVAAAKVVSIDWIFNPPGGPWFGGFYERLVSSIKLPLRKTVQGALLHYDELVTVLCEIEAVVNERPLTTVADLDDEEALSPAKLMGADVWSRDSSLSKPLDKVGMRRRHKYVLMVTEHLKTRWSKEYLTQLRAYHDGISRPVQENDVVLIANDNQRRHLWRMARVRRLLPGKDGRVRVAEVAVAGGGVMLRPIRRLLPLEVVDVEPNQEKGFSRSRTRSIRPPKRLGFD